MTLNPIRVAIEDVEKIASLAKDGGLGKKFRTRARSLPGLISEIGLVPTLSFCYGKAGKDVYRSVKNWFFQNAETGSGNEEEKGYALYLLITLNYLSRLGLINQAETEDVVKALEKLSDKEIIASKLVQPYLLQVKRLSEALFEPEGAQEPEGTQ